MMNSDIYLSSVREAGDWAGVFDSDSEVSYFYSMNPQMPAGQQILGAIHIYTGKQLWKKKDVHICWNNDATAVGLVLFGQLWAVFDEDSQYGGDFDSQCEASIPNAIKLTFSNHFKLP